MKTGNIFKMSWAGLILALFGLSFLLLPGSAIAAAETACVSTCSIHSSVPNVQDFKLEDLFVDPSKQVCKVGTAAYEYQDWYQWKPSIVIPNSDRQMALYTGRPVDRMPARSND